LRKGSRPKLSFDKILLVAIDEALSSLGDSVKASIYFHLEKTYGIKRCEIPLRINDFSKALEKIFGIGAKHLEILFMKHLHVRAGVTCEWPSCKRNSPEVTFQEYVGLMKRNFEDVHKKEEMRFLIDAYEQECV
jgi:hypothetical protein